MRHFVFRAFMSKKYVILICMIGILTDFGLEDPYVGIMKGVISRIKEDTSVIDITHHINSFDILKGAFYLASSYKYFPEHSVFLCVVDPGVGSQRAPIACAYKDYFFVGPMNGIFDMVFEERPLCVDISSHPYILKPTSNTFHGRDIFAPAAGFIEVSKSIESLGPHIDYQYHLKIPKPVIEKDIIKGQILFYDKFGNAITNVECRPIKHAIIEDRKIEYFEYFSQAPYIGITCGSFRYLEFFVNKGSFKDVISSKEFALIL